MEFLVKCQGVKSLSRLLAPGRVLAAALVAGCLLFAGSTAMAADGGGDDGEVEEQLEQYWSTDRELETVRKRQFTREGRGTIGLFAGLLSSEPFYWYLPVGLRGGYYFSNFYGIEVEGSFMDVEGILYNRTDLNDFLSQTRQDAFDEELHTDDRFKWRAHAMFMWHPLYGKLSVLQRKLSHFDFNLGVGLGAMSVRRPNATRTEATTAIVPDVVVGGGIQFFATDSINVRLEGRGYLYQGAETPSADNFWKRLEFPSEFLLGVNYMF